jgi:hypothetical protein
VRKTKYLIIALLLGAIGLGGAHTLSATHTQQGTVQGIQTQVVTPSLTPTPTEVITPTQKVAPILHPTASTQSGLSNDRYYTNTSGNEVHSPAYSNDSSVPAGATAKCGDGTHSFSQHRSGTCSHHGGVALWF